MTPLTPDQVYRLRDGEFVLWKYGPAPEDMDVMLFRGPLLGDFRDAVRLQNRPNIKDYPNKLYTVSALENLFPYRPEFDLGWVE